MKITRTARSRSSLGLLALSLGAHACGDDGSSSSAAGDAAVDASNVTQGGESGESEDSALSGETSENTGRALTSAVATTSSDVTWDVVSSGAATDGRVSTDGDTTIDTGTASETGSSATDGSVALGSDGGEGSDASSQPSCDDGCVIAGDCYADGARNPEDPCAVCAPSANANGWTIAEDGASCEDGFACNGVDTCQQGACVHAGSPCGDHEACDEVEPASYECQCASAWTGPECQRCLLYVSPEGDDANSGGSWSAALASVQTALTAASNGGCEVWVAAGTYRPVPVFNQDPHYATFELVSGVDLYGGFAGNESLREQRDVAAHETVLSGDLAGDDDASEPDTLLENSYRVVTGADNARIDGFTITQGNGHPYKMGAGIYILETSPTIENCRIVGNSAYEGGGAYIFDGSPTFIDTVFEDNQAQLNGGGALVTGAANLASPTFTGCSFADNTAQRGGGVAVQDASMVVTGSTFELNVASNGGGAISGSNSTYSISGSSFVANSTPQTGGAIQDFTSVLQVTDSTFSENTATIFGGAISADNTSLWLTGGVLSGNSAMTGGAVFVSDVLAAVDGSSFDDNAAVGGAALAVFGGADTRVVGASFTGNTGGALMVDDSELTLVGTTLSSNASEDNSGAIAATAESTVLLFGCTLEGNSGTYGGAISAHASTAVVEGSVLHGNTATWDGGALYFTASSVARITNSTLTGNSAALRGGAAAFTASFVNIANSIFWNDSSGDTDPEIYGAFTSVYSDVQGGCIENDNCASGNRNVDPLFVDPANADFRLQVNSPLIGGGDIQSLEEDVADLDGDENTTEDVPFDRAGNPRIWNEAVDMGAYEFSL